MAIDVRTETSYWKSGFNQLTGTAAKNGSYTNSFPTFSRTQTSSREHYKMRDWKVRIARGVNATTVFNGSLESFVNKPTEQYLYLSTVPNPPNDVPLRRQSTFWDNGFTGLPLAVADSLLSQATNAAQQNFYKRLESVSTLFQGGVFLGELRETLHQIRNPAKSLRKAVDNYLSDLKKGRKGSRSRKEAFLSKTWLEHSFGWAPLLNDLDEARSYLDRRSDQLAQELIRVIGQAEAKGHQFYNPSFGTGIANIYAQIRVIYHATARYSGAVSSRASSNRLIDSSALGLSPRSFVPTLWEVMPWSFAIDYFTNIGDVLTAWSNQTVGLAWGCETLRKSAEADLIGVVDVVPPLAAPSSEIYDHLLVKGSAQSIRRTVTRRPITYVPIPSFRFELPGFGTKWLNLAALAAARRDLSYY